MNSKISIWYIIVYISACIAVGFLGSLPPWWRWTIFILLFLGFFMLVGWHLHRRLDGIFIDSRFKMSLARFQIILWTLLTFSAFFTIALERNRLLAEELLEATKQGQASSSTKKLPLDFNPLDIQFPKELLIALGISTASLAGSAIIKNVKRETETGKRLDLLLDEEKKATRQKQEANAKISDAQARLEQLAQDETAIRAEHEKKKRNHKELTKKMEDEKEEQKKLLSLAEADLTADPGNQNLKVKVENAEKVLKEIEANLEKANQTWAIEEMKFAGQIEYFKAETTKAGEKITSTKSELTKAEGELDRIEQAKRNKEGLIHKNLTPAEADWIDIFRGDEIGNYQVIDVSKVQMFFLTIAIVSTYGVLIWLSLTSEGLRQAAFAFPAFSDSMNALMGLSHAGYLIVKGSG